MPKKRSSGARKAPKSKKLPRKLPEDAISRAVAIMREATERAVGDAGDKITRAPKKPKRLT